MKNVIIFLFLTLIFFTACSTKEILITEQTTESIIENNIVSSSQIIDFIQLETTIEIQETKADSSEVTTIITEYSEPDSFGNQSIVRTITRVTKNNIKTNKAIVAEIIDSSRREQNNTYIDKSKLEFNSKIKTTSKIKENGNLLSKILIWIVIVLVVVLIITWKKWFPFT